jgi:site-specific DNA-methyltransferase (adenine-specific)
MKPYFERNGIAIYHGNCLEVMPRLTVTPDLVLTDPPYNASNSNIDFQEKGYNTVDLEWDKNFDPMPPMELAWKLLSERGSLLTFCSYHLLGRYLNWKEPQQIVHWRKTNPFPAIAKVWTPTVEYAVWFTKGSPYTFNKTFAGQNVIDAPICAGHERTEHPTQKPEILMQKLLLVHAPENGTVLDCFMGSGTTLAAAKTLNLKAIGIELEEKYCEIAAKRLEQEVFAFE